MIWNSPWFLLSALSIPVLIGIYLLRNRFREHPVSSLVLWQRRLPIARGGRSVKKMPFPLLFFIEFLALILLTIAAAGPFIIRDTAKPLIVILDDSFSMNAAADGLQSPRRLIEEQLYQLLDHHPDRTITLLLAGGQPRMAGEPCRNRQQLQHRLQGWNCRSDRADLGRAIGLARKLSRNNASLLVMTDHAPLKTTPSDVHWYTFGRALPNLAFVDAARSRFEQIDKCFVRIANISDNPSQATLKIEFSGPPVKVSRRQLTFQPNEVKKLTIPIPLQQSTVTKSLDDDVLKEDNSIFLAPVPLRPVRVQVKVNDKAINQLVHKALRESGRAKLCTDKPQLIISDSTITGASTSAWRFNILTSPKSKPFKGPFVMNTAHPLLEGFSPNGIIWGGHDLSSHGGLPLLTAGNVQLLQEIKRKGQRIVHFSFNPKFSNLQNSPEWPILIWNLLDWRSSHLEGPEQFNVRAGDKGAIRLKKEIKEVTLTGPDNQPKRLAARAGKVIFNMNRPGYYKIEAGEETMILAASNRSLDESNLLKAKHGEWADTELNLEFRAGYENMTWIFLIITLALLTGHLYMASKRPGE